MLVVQKIVDDSNDLKLKVVNNKVFQNHKALIKDMKDHPAQYNEGCEYTTIELGKFLKVTYPKIAVVETVEEESGNG